MGRARHGWAALLLAGTLLAGGARGELRGQVLAAGLGAATGMAAGGYITLSVVVAGSRTGHYVANISDVLGWGSIPVLAGGATGAALGWFDPPRLWGVMGYGAAGTVLGAALGALVGHLAWSPPEGKWAGAAIGAGLGLIAGSTIGVLYPIGHGGGGPLGLSGARVPIAVRVPF